MYISPYFLSRKRTPSRVRDPRGTALCVSPTPSEQPTGVTFSPAGLLTPYHIGVAQVLRERGRISPSVPLGGASGGALVAVALALDLPFDQILDACISLNAQCTEHGTQWNLHGILANVLDELLEDDVAFRVNARADEHAAPVVIGITRLFHKTHLAPRGVFVSTFQDRAHLIEALLCSCAIPLYFSRWPALSYRGWPALDGFFAGSRADFGAPALSDVGVDRRNTLRVCPFSAPSVGMDLAPESGPAITPHLRTNTSTTDSEKLLRWALGQPPPSESQVGDLYDAGRSDAGRFLKVHTF
ncbi:Patatin-like phospholipase domain-containing protein 3 [Porphyridium purpureum]|uniref:Patatin-like phospholipase domain-containing protein 3 n=1 Tax=Porphyridium purpureum TaxID=35688 RepID=A0A5J4YUA8_PORPP|nr:Patatin-like phospholipase domain-containing protein 3 [Porphyridium purpureum]|eukprot:POR2949..scf227_4